MAGRRVENQRRQKYGTSSYVSGNTVRKLAAAPQRRYEEYEIPKEVEITEEDRIAIRKKRKAIHRANRLNFLYTVGVSYCYYNICNMLTISECPVTGQD